MFNTKITIERKDRGVRRSEHSSARTYASRRIRTQEGAAECDNVVFHRHVPTIALAGQPNVTMKYVRGISEAYCIRCKSWQKTKGILLTLGQSPKTFITLFLIKP